MTDTSTFEDLVNEAFITPLRSVLIVDDQYPTWEEVFNSKLSTTQVNNLAEPHSATKSWHSSATANEVLRLIMEFRDRRPGFIIDIYDGISADGKQPPANNETSAELASHLHQSDLLILDYNLEGATTGAGGDAARKILSSILSNQHFNLVVVHTSEPLDNVIHECLRSLMPSCISLLDEACIVKISELDRLITEKEDEGAFDRTKVYEKLDLASYIQARHPYEGKHILSDFMQGKGILTSLSAWFDELQINKRQKKTFFFWAISTFEKQHSAGFAKSLPKGLVWKVSNEHKWLRTSQGFVCFVKKGPQSILSELQGALVDWKPTPSRLLSAKYRDEISRMGSDIEDTSLMRKHALAKFYETICSPSPNSLSDIQLKTLRRNKLKDHVFRQSEMLSFLVEDNVADFGQRIYDADISANLDLKSHYMVDLKVDAENITAINQYNHYISCLPTKEKALVSSTEQLSSGHIFKIDSDWWVCATPACDLQAGQGVIAFEGDNNSDLRPFTAMKLHPIKKLNQISPYHINSGSYCFIEYQGHILGLGITSPKDDIEKPSTQKVKWQSFIAKNGGIIEGGKLELLTITLELENSNIKSNHMEAEVVAKLRYEYALNYIQRIGTSVSRIGLAYVS